MNYSRNRRSLVERKRIQWEREKEEMEQICTTWGLKSMPLVMHNLATNCNHNQTTILPSIYNHNKNIRIVDPESSGYVSEVINHFSPTTTMSTDYHHRGQQTPVSTSTEDAIQLGGVNHDGTNNNNNNGDEVVWNLDKKYALPKWLQRRLKMPDGQMMVVNSNSSPEYSSQHFTSESGSETNMYLRGQNTYVEPIEMLEREKRRKRALEYQREIRKQLEEKELKRQEERERRILEEIKEEKRIERESEMERERVAEEKKALLERQEKDKKKRDKIHEAIIKAEQEAKKDKANLRLAKIAPCNHTMVPDVKEQFSEQKTNDVEIQTKDPELQDNQHVYNQLTTNLNQPQFAVMIPPIFLPNYLHQTDFSTNTVRLKDIGTQTDVVETDIEQVRRPSTSIMLISLFEKLKSIEKFQQQLFDTQNHHKSKDVIPLQKDVLVNERPKWGANHPVVKYVKQSDKDLNRKTVEKNRWVRNDDEYSCTTSEDSLRDRKSTWHRLPMSKKTKMIARDKSTESKRNTVGYGHHYRKLPNFQLLQGPEKQSCIDDLLVENLDSLSIDYNHEKDTVEE